MHSQIASYFSRIHVDLHDGKNGTTTVVFDKEMAKITNKDASTLALEEVRLL